MHVKELLDMLDIRVKLPQHWYSTDISDEFEHAELIENDKIIKIKTEYGKHPRFINIDVDDGMSVVTLVPCKKVIGVKYLNNKDDFEYIGRPSDLYFKD